MLDMAYSVDISQRQRLPKAIAESHAIRGLTMFASWIDIDPINFTPFDPGNWSDYFTGIIHAQDATFSVVSHGLPVCDWCKREVANPDKLPLFHHKLHTHGKRLAEAWKSQDNWIAPAEESESYTSRFDGGNGAYHKVNSEFNHWLSWMASRSPSERESRDEIQQWLSDERDSMATIHESSRERTGTHIQQHGKIIHASVGNAMPASEDTNMPSGWNRSYSQFLESLNVESGECLEVHTPSKPRSLTFLESPVKRYHSPAFDAVQDSIDAYFQGVDTVPVPTIDAVPLMLSWLPFVDGGIRHTPCQRRRIVDQS